MDRIDKAHAYPNRSFHNLVTIHRLVVWGLAPEPIEENLAHEETTRRSKCRLLRFIFYLILLILYILHHRVSHYEKKTKGKTWLVVLKVRRTSRSKTKQPHWLSRSLSSRLGRGKSFQAILTLVIFQDIEVLRNKSLIRLLLPRFQSFRP